jgi:hypothetical protein
MTNETKNELGWLIRDTSNAIRGPFPHGEVLQLIKKNQLKAKTEISRANSYWFAVEEKAELAKFFPELGLKAPEQNTQMTATLTEADLHNHGMDVTQFTPALGGQAEAPAKAVESEPVGGGQVQWLSEEFASEFGEELGFAESGGAVQESAPAVELAANPAGGPAPGAEPGPAGVAGRSVPPAGSPPKGEKPPTEAKSSAPSVISMEPSRPETHAHIISEESPKVERAAKPGIGKAAVAGVVAIALLGGGYLLLPKHQKPVKRAAVEAAGATISGPPEEVIRKSLALFQLDSAKDALGKLEHDPKFQRSALVPLADAVVKKEFLYDTDGALVSLQAAKGMKGEKPLQAEVENLSAI